MNGDVRVAVVNDTEAIADLIEDLLKDRGQPVLTRLLDGKATAEAILAAAPDLVFLGLRPRQRGDGWDLLAAIRADPRLRDVPVILCTGDLRGLREREAEIAGDPRTHVLEKPFGLEGFESTMEAALPV